MSNVVWLKPKLTPRIAMIERVAKAIGYECTNIGTVGTLLHLAAAISAEIPTRDRDSFNELMVTALRASLARYGEQEA